MKEIQKNPHLIDLLSCILSILSIIHLFLILFNTYCRIYSIPEESKYTAVFLSINNETQCVPLILLSLRFITYAPSFILGKLFFEKRH